jgi:hypothetical protein
MVTGLTDLLKVTTMVLLTGTSWAPAAGVTAVTKSGPASGVPSTPVVKVLPNGTTVLPARSAKSFTVTT